MSDGCTTAYSDLVNSDEIFEDAIKADPSLADGLNVGSCKTFREEKNEDLSSSVCVGVKIGPYCGGPSTEPMKDQTITETTEGCESVAIQHALNLGISKALSCTSNSLSKKSRTETSTIQALRIVFRDINTRGGDFNVDMSQKSETEAKVIDFTSMEVQKEFKNTVEQELETLQESMQTAETDEFATGNSNKSLQQSIAASISSSADMNLTEVIQEAVASVVTKQGQDLIYEGIDTGGGDFNVKKTQEAVTKLTIDSVTKAVVGHISENSSMQKSISTMKSTQENIKKSQAKYTGIFSVMLFMMFTIIGCLVVFSIHRWGHSYMLPSYRLMCFWIAFVFTLLMVAIPVFREFEVIWIFSLVLLILAIIFSFFEIGKTNEKFSFGNGFQFIFAPYADAVNSCKDRENNKYCTLFKSDNFVPENVLLSGGFQTQQQVTTQGQKTQQTQQNQQQKTQGQKTQQTQQNQQQKNQKQQIQKQKQQFLSAAGNYADQMNKQRQQQMNKQTQQQKNIQQQTQSLTTQVQNV